MFSSSESIHAKTTHCLGLCPIEQYWDHHSYSIASEVYALRFFKFADLLVVACDNHFLSVKFVLVTLLRARLSSTSRLGKPL